MGVKGLERIVNVGPRMTEVVEGLIRDSSGVQMCDATLSEDVVAKTRVKLGCCYSREVCTK